MQKLAWFVNQLGVHDGSGFVCIKNAKILAFLLVIGLICYHGLLHISYGNDSCQWLLADGRFHGSNRWQPVGCMLHEYSKSDARNCMRYIAYWGGYNYIAFVGDSRIRQLYYEFVQLLSNENVKTKKAHSDLNFHDDKLRVVVEFFWFPVVNESMLDLYRKWINRKPDARPSLIITGSATWSIKTSNASKIAIINFRDNLTAIVPAFEELSYSTPIIWMLQDPVFEQRLSANRTMITNVQIDEYNKAAFDQLFMSSVHIWSSSRLVAQGFIREMDDGIHAGKQTLHWDVQLLANMYCNKHLNFNDATCCMPSEPVTVTQTVCISLFVTSLVIAVSMSVRRIYINLTNVYCTQRPSKVSVSDNDTSNVIYHWICCFSRLAVIMLYFFLCDRTMFFMKENKHYTHMSFFLPFAYLMILGIFFHENTKQVTLLNRDQTEEWKGCMQLLILIYHFTGASQVLPIYMQIRVLVSSYLFLSGYGHFLYFFERGDFSIHRLFTVLFRYNFLVVLLCLVMNRPYQFYYFVPMVSFWFVVMYIVLSVWPRITSLTSGGSLWSNYFMTLLKFAVLSIAITLLFTSQPLFNKLFLSFPLKTWFLSVDDSLNDWRFRWQLDRYSVLYGMLFALIVAVTKKFSCFEDSPSLFGRLWRAGAAILAVAGLIGYELFVLSCKSKQSCNETHTYIVIIPIFAYIYLRNVHSCLRAKYSVFFAWFGKISLELFIAQYHIWMSTDTHGMLVLVPNFPMVNVVVTSFVFVCVAHEVHCVTNQLLPVIVPNDPWKLAYNIVAIISVGIVLAVVR